MMDQRGIGRVPLLLHELRAGDRLRAAGEIVGDRRGTPALADRALRELVNCSDDALRSRRPGRLSIR